MSKLYYKFGTVSSAKTMNLLATAYNYSLSGKKVCIIKPQIDNRFGEEIVKSRAGSEKKADIVLDQGDKLFNKTEDWINSDIILVDECQFLSIKQINELWQITCNFGIDVICYGLRADFNQKLFDASQRLFEISDNIQEVTSTCNRCNSVAIHNLKIDDYGDAIFEGPSIEIGDGTSENFIGVCSKCYLKAKKKTETKS
jgi:thymidine kinase